MFSLLPRISPARARRWSWTPGRAKRVKSLRLLETVSLGERRYVALIEAQGQRLLIGTTPQSMTLLSDFGGLRAGDSLHGASGAPLVPLGVN